MKNPFRYFNSSPEIIRLTVMMYIRYPLSLRQVEDILFERTGAFGRQSSVLGIQNDSSCQHHSTIRGAPRERRNWLCQSKRG